MTSKKRSEREERFLGAGEQRYQMPPLINADPEEIGRKIMGVRGYAKKGISKAKPEQS